VIAGGVPADRSGRKAYSPAVVLSVTAVSGPRGWRDLLGTTFAGVALFVLLPVIVAVVCWTVLAGIGERLSAPGPVAWMSPERLAEFAAFISGSERTSDLREEWHAHLAGESGAGLPRDRQARVAAGLVVGAVRYRLQDLADLVWRPVDAMLKSRALSGMFILVPTLWVSVLFIAQGGLYGLADHLEAMAVAWGAAVGLIHLARKWREVKPPERKPRRQSE
jgi:hypothetical protein